MRMSRRSRSRLRFRAAYLTGRTTRMRAARSMVPLDTRLRHQPTPTQRPSRSLPMMCSAMAVGFPASSARTRIEGLREEGILAYEQQVARRNVGSRLCVKDPPWRVRSLRERRRRYPAPCPSRRTEIGGGPEEIAGSNGHSLAGSLESRPAARRRRRRHGIGPHPARGCTESCHPDSTRRSTRHPRQLPVPIPSAISTRLS